MIKSEIVSQQKFSKMQQEIMEIIKILTATIKKLTAFFRSIDHKILVRAWLPSPYIVVHSFEKGCKSK
jgi:hypothetical protein